MPILIVYRNDEEQRRYPIVREQMLLGRDPTCDVVLSDDTVSRRHARIQYADPSFNLYSMSGTKPMRVEGRESRYAVLEDGARFELGVFTVEFKRDGGPAPEVLERVSPSEVYRPREEVRRTTGISDEMKEALKRREEE